MRYFITDEEYDFARKRGISKSTVYARVFKYNWPIDRAIYEVPKKLSADVIKARDIAVSNGVPRETFYDRRRNGWTLEEASTTPVLTREQVVERARQSTIFSREHIHTCNLNGISLATARARLAHGWTMAEATTLPIGTVIRHYRTRQNKTTWEVH